MKEMQHENSKLKMEIQQNTRSNEILKAQTSAEAAERMAAVRNLSGLARRVKQDAKHNSPLVSFVDCGSDGKVNLSHCTEEIEEPHKYKQPENHVSKHSFKSKRSNPTEYIINISKK